MKLSRGETENIIDAFNFDAQILFVATVICSYRINKFQDYLCTGFSYYHM